MRIQIHDGDFGIRVLSAHTKIMSVQRFVTAAHDQRELAGGEDFGHAFTERLLGSFQILFTGDAAVFVDSIHVRKGSQLFPDFIRSLLRTGTPLVAVHPFIGTESYEGRSEE